MLFVKTKNSNNQSVYAYYHHDHLNTPIQATDKYGKVVWAARYSAFGQVNNITPTATGDNPVIESSLRFPGQIEDSETGLYYNWRRYYDPEVGRYVTQDPIGLEGGMNLYSYAGGNPVNISDSTGEFGVGGAIVGAGIDFFFQMATNGFRIECVNLKSIALSAALGAVGAVGWSKIADRGLRAGAGMFRPHPAFPRGKEWVERSHFIPRSWFPDKLKKYSWSKYNIKYMWGEEHAMADWQRYKKLKKIWKDLPGNEFPNETLDRIKRFFDRMPDWLKGAAGGGAVGTAIGPGCECQ